MFKSDGSRREFSLTRDRIVIGRTNEVGLRIPLSSVSRKHCEIAIEDGVVKMRDLGSSNGTLHNSVRVKEAVLAAGDQVEVGPVVFTVVIDGVPAEFEPVRSLVEQELVDTSVGLPAVQENESAPEKASPSGAKVVRPSPRVEQEVAGEVESEAQAANSGPPAGESFSDGATVVDLDDPIAALERLAAAEQELADEFTGVTRQKDAKKAKK